VVVISRAHIVSAEAGHQSFNKCAAAPTPLFLIHQSSVPDPRTHTRTHTREPTLHCVVKTNQEGAHKAQLTYGNAHFAPPGWHIT
jgi:hypothetical protein